MNKTIKATIFLVAAVLNALFFYLCGYWQQIQFHTPTYQKIGFTTSTECSTLCRAASGKIANIISKADLDE